MTKKENIKTYTLDEIKAMRAAGQSRTDYARLDAMTDAERNAVDPEEGEFDWMAAIPGIPSKEQLTLRLDADIVEWFKSQGKGYQTRMNAVLRGYVKAHQHDKTAR